MEIARKRSPNHDDRIIRKALVFERALHRWDRWLDSLANGRKILRFQHLHPSLEEMRDVAKNMLAKLDFPACTIFELYWLCCVFANYRTAHGFKFDKLVLPDWFPFPPNSSGTILDSVISRESAFIRPKCGMRGVIESSGLPGTQCYNTCLRRIELYVFRIIQTEISY